MNRGLSEDVSELQSRGVSSTTTGTGSIGNRM